MRRGEVWWAAAPSGTRRPYLVLTRTVALEVLHRVHAVPATRTRRGIPTEVSLDADDGMPQPCALSLDNLELIPAELFERRICTLGPARMAQVCRALELALDC